MKKFLLLIVMIIMAISCLAVEVARWTAQPINVYIPEYGNKSVLMQQAFNSWQNKSGNLVRFKFVSRPSNADIEVKFVDFVTNCNSDNSVGCTHLYTRNGEFKKAYITIGTKEYQYKGQSKQIVSRSKEHIYGVMLHEVGHAIGLEHSDSSGSIMYPYDLDSMQYLTKRDMKLLYNKYH